MQKEKAFSNVSQSHRQTDQNAFHTITEVIALVLRANTVST
jgi:hypothetical protein